MKRFLSAVIALMMILLTFPITVGAAAGVTQTLDMAALNKNSKGTGYEWNNSEYVFTMKDLDLKTSDDYGIKLPAGSTVVIEGDNTIVASRYGIQSFGSLTFTGSGTLTVTVSDIGIRALTTQDRENVIFRSGKLVINARTAILSETGKTVFSGADIKAVSTVNSVYGLNLHFVGGKLDLTSPIYAKGSVEIKAIDLTVSAAAPAITAEKGILTEEVDISTGTSLSALGKADAYHGENAVKFVSTAKVVKHGMLFGGKLPAFVDYIVFALIAIAAAAVIAVPIIIKKKKTAKLIEQSKVYKVSEK